MANNSNNSTEKVSNLFKNRYPFYIFNISERVLENGNRIKNFHYKTPKINSDSCLNITNVEDLDKLIIPMNKYINSAEEIIFSEEHNFNVVTSEINIYVKRFIEDNETEYIKMIGLTDDELDYLEEDITPNFFLIPFEIHVEAKLIFEYFVEEEEEDSFFNNDVFNNIISEERRDIPTFKIFKADNCVIC